MIIFINFLIIFINFPEKSGTVCTKWGRKAKHVGHGKGVRDGEYKIPEGASWLRVQAKIGQKC